MNLIDKILYIFVFISVMFAQFNWDDNGTPIRQGYHIEWQRTADIGSDNEVIFAWSDTRNGDRDIYANKIDNNGSELWDINGNIVIKDSGRQEDPQLVTDGNGVNLHGSE